jgi:5,10-methylenetetrahydromethanopterin reductase
MAIRFSLRLNNDLPPGDLVVLAQTAEAVGFDQFWVSNDLFLRSALVMLPMIAQATQRIQIGSGIFNPYTLHPAELAMFATTMDEVSGNRFNLGLSAGAADFLKWVGIEQAAPAARLRETVDAVRCLQAGERVEIKGQTLQWSSEAYLRVAAPRQTPIYIGALGPRMLALAGEIADGVLPLLFPPEHYFGVKPLIDQGVAKRAAHLRPLDLAACIWVALDQDRTAARQVLAAKIAYYGHALSPLIWERLGLTRGDFDPIEQAMMVERDAAKAVALVDDRMLRIGVVGGPQEVVERLRPLAAAGVTHFSFGPPLGPEPLAAVRLLGQVMDALQTG